MLTLYSNQGSGNCYKVRLLLKQLGLPFRVVEIDVVAGEQKRPDHLARNPNGKTPTIELEDGSHLSESGAILYYFARDTPLWPEGRRQQAEVLQWMFFEQYSHEPNIAVARYWCHFLNAEEDYRVPLKEKRERGCQALHVMDRHLGRREFFAAERYTIADIALYAYTHVAHQGGFSLNDYPAVRDWLDRVADQPLHIPITDVC